MNKPKISLPDFRKSKEEKPKKEKPKREKPRFNFPKPQINYQLSKREKVLLYVLGIFFLAMLFLWVVLFPGIEKFQSVTEAKQEAELKQKEMKMAIDALPINEAAKASAQADQDAKKEQYLPLRSNTDLDRLVTTMATDIGFTINTLSVTENKEGTVPTFVEETTNGSEPTPAPTPTPEPTVEGEANTGGLKFFIGTVSINVEGNLGMFNTLLESIAERKDLQLVSFDLAPGGNNTGDTSATDVESGINTANVVINAYMINK